MDLLLYLVKRHEVDVIEVPIARIAEEFIAYIDVIQDLAIDQVGEFVELASVLLEIKARSLVPTNRRSVEHRQRSLSAMCTSGISLERCRV